MPSSRSSRRKWRMSIKLSIMIAALLRSCTTFLKTTFSRSMKMQIYNWCLKTISNSMSARIIWRRIVRTLLGNQHSRLRVCPLTHLTTIRSILMAHTHKWSYYLLEANRSVLLRKSYISELINDQVSSLTTTFK